MNSGLGFAKTAVATFALPDAEQPYIATAPLAGRVEPVTASARFPHGLKRAMRTKCLCVTEENTKGASPGSMPERYRKTISMRGVSWRGKRKRNAIPERSRANHSLHGSGNPNRHAGQNYSRRFGISFFFLRFY